jgi:succinate dehydrogenase / fumarate reductase cytochrome b subunit
MKSDYGRPLSPSIQVYRWPLAMALSILHRASGIALGVGAVMLVWWLAAAADGPTKFENARRFLGSWIGLVLLFGWSVALFYHLCAGLRHLWWDTGRGLDLPSVYFSNWAVIAGTLVLTSSHGLSACRVGELPRFGTHTFSARRMCRAGSCNLSADCPG